MTDEAVPGDTQLPAGQLRAQAPVVVLPAPATVAFIDATDLFDQLSAREDEEQDELGSVGVHAALLLVQFGGEEVEVPSDHRLLNGLLSVDHVVRDRAHHADVRPGLEMSHEDLVPARGEHHVVVAEEHPLSAGDGQASWQNSIFNKSFTGNISSGDAIREVIDSFNLDIGKLEGLPSAKDKIRGQTLSGASKDIMDKMAEEYGFTWSIQDGEIITTPLDTPISNFEAVVLTSSTGMINSPVITEVGADVSSLLNRNLVPNGVFQIKSESADTSLSNIFLRESIPRTSAEGFYKVQEVTHRGDSRRGDWLSNIKGITFNV